MRDSKNGWLKREKFERGFRSHSFTNMPEISQPTQNLIKQYRSCQAALEPKEGAVFVHVDEVASKVASFYEKIRKVVDWKEEHLLRRAAIERVLKRRLLLRKSSAEAEPLVLELIRSGHFPNDRIEETKVADVQKALSKYLFIFENEPQTKEGQKTRFNNWLLDIAACEIEEILSPPLKEKSLIEYMTDVMDRKIEVSGNTVVYSRLPEEEKRTQTFIACQRALFKLNEPIITYYLLQRKYRNWSDLKEPQLKEIALNVYSIRSELEKELHHPLSEKFYKVCEKYDTAFLILGDVLAENPQEASKTLSSPEIFENSVKKFYASRLQAIKSKMTRAATFSTVSIFATKILVVLAIEVPFEKYFLDRLDYQTLGINVLIPPLLMLFLVSTIKPPRKENLDRVIMETMKLAYEKSKKDIYTIKPTRKRGVIFGAVIALFYVFTFLVSFGAIVWGLRKLNFGILSIVIFLMFFSLIAFAGAKIRERAKELEISEEKAGFFAFLIDSFSLPFLRTGRWLSHQWSKYNVVVVLITAFIDMPFQVFTEFVEQWRTFLKEKKEEIH
ncbi:MAG: Uncharacterized protein G01um101430_732 [Parcubacteria group bacterium Gr01-1014_30]|nr:MAG: Uncharacterized protein G01um101430_732 [Parcubacteria group bacterium Gr01-1014_30]